jgi:NADH-quinone oxidoreductase subunit I
MIINVRKKYLKRTEGMSFIDSIYLPAVIKGMLITLKHFLFTKNWTIQYPEELKPDAPRFRGRHVMKRDELNRERCTACYCCQYSCPADCIVIQAAEVTPDIQHNHPEDKYAKSFEIDLLRCIFCGFCQDACPKAAIFLEEKYDLAGSGDRSSYILTKDQMMELKGGKPKIRL